VPVWPHDGHFCQTQAKDQAEQGVEPNPEDCRRAHALNGEWSDTGNEDCSGEADNECAPPVCGLSQT
jgi:hypothetical protein